MNNIASPSVQRPGFFRRLAAIFYDWVLLIAVILVAVTLYTVATNLLFGENAAADLLKPLWAKLLYQLYLVSVGCLFYIWFWTHGGQTLGLKVWKLKIVDFNLQPVSTRKALLRLLLAVASCIPLGLGLVWQLFDRQKMTLYDRWSGTQLVSVEHHKVNSDDE